MCSTFSAFFISRFFFRSPNCFLSIFLFSFSLIQSFAIAHSICLFVFVNQYHRLKDFIIVIIFVTKSNKKIVSNCGFLLLLLLLKNETIFFASKERLTEIGKLWFKKWLTIWGRFLTVCFLPVLFGFPTGFFFFWFLLVYSVLILARSSSFIRYLCCLFVCLFFSVLLQILFTWVEIYILHILFTFISLFVLSLSALVFAYVSVSAVVLMEFLTFCVLLLLVISIGFLTMAFRYFINNFCG